MKSQILDEALRGFVWNLPEVADGEWMFMATSWYWSVHKYQDVFLILVGNGDMQGYSCDCVSLYSPSHGDTLPWEKDRKEIRSFMEELADESVPPQLPLNVERIHIHFNHF
jgi:hypothetical protein